jgi:hypothetical protein
MRLWSLLNARNPLWRFLGWGTLAGVVTTSGLFIILGPRPLPPKAPNDLFRNSEGKFGTITEQLGEGRIFVLDYDTILGDQENLELSSVKARLFEPETQWLLGSPTGHRASGKWTLMSPMDIEARMVPTGAVQGQGTIQGTGPALLWEHGVWRGLKPLVWQDLAGQGKGRWYMPAGWHRELDGKFVVEKGPVVWEATEPGLVRRMQAERLWTTFGFREGHLDQVAAELEGGRIWAGSADMQGGAIHWSAPIRFEREDGWRGNAENGRAPLPEKQQPLRQVELKDFRAQRAVAGGAEKLQAEGTRWTPAGLRLEGEVRWEQPQDDQQLVLRCPRVFIREGAGADLPEALPIGEAWAEGHPVLSWGPRSLSSPRMEARRKERTWRIQAPVYGRGEQGTFSAGAGHGSPRRWEFQGPVKANVLNGGSLRGDRLVWEAETWTFFGNPATWSRFRERLSGPRIVRKNTAVSFPDGVAGALASMDGDFRVRADRADYQPGEVLLTGRVEGQGRGWRLQADRISVTLGPGNIVKKIIAKGAVTLRGRMGEGWGESLELEPDPTTPKARWQGRVRGLAEIEGKP